MTPHGKSHKSNVPKLFICHKVALGVALKFKASKGAIICPGSSVLHCFWDHCGGGQMGNCEHMICCCGRLGSCTGMKTHLMPNLMRWKRPPKFHVHLTHRKCNVKSQEISVGNSRAPEGEQCVHFVAWTARGA